MTDSFSKYEAMKQAGVVAEQVYLQAVRDNIDPITRIRLIRSVFSLSAREAKEVTIRAEGESESLDQFQEELAKKMSEKSDC